MMSSKSRFDGSVPMERFRWFFRSINRLLVGNMDMVGNGMCY